MNALETVEMPIDTVQSLKTDTMKRRSSIFQRRSINICQDYIESDCEETKSKLESESEPFDLTKYISSVCEEKAEWRRMLRERKARRRQLTKELNSRDEVEFDLSILSESERAFILDRPDYEGVSKSIDNLRSMALKVSALNLQMYDMQKALIEKIRKEIASTKRAVLNLPEV